MKPYLHKYLHKYVSTFSAENIVMTIDESNTNTNAITDISKTVVNWLAATVDISRHMQNKGRSRPSRIPMHSL